MKKTTQAIIKMTDYYRGNQSDISHFLKVYGFAKTIGEAEGLNEVMQETLELAAIAHDISCPLCKAKYGNSAGYYQQIESEPLVRDFFEEFSLPEEQMERIVYLINHHHTYTNVGGLDYQILLEADYLVNCGESEKYARNLPVFLTKYFKTETGIQLLRSMYVLR